jgi:ribosome biogenesis protein ERB1
VPLLKWDKAPEAKRESGIWLNLDIKGTPAQVAFHRKSDYFSSVSPDGATQAVLIHQISKHHTQAPFRKLKGPIERAVFHPSKPHLFVATQRDVKVYDLAGQALLKTLNPGVKMISSIDVHPLGDNVLVGSYDKRLVWHDLDLSDRPYKTLRFHSKAVRSVAFSPSHPLFFSASDDATIHVFHASVYTDLVTEPLIVPVKVLKGHEVTGALGVLQAKWHPKEPWIASVGSDGVGRLWVN